MTVGEYLQNRQTLQQLTDQYGHEKAREILTQGGKAQEAARKKLQRKIQDSIELAVNPEKSKIIDSAILALFD